MRNLTRRQTIAALAGGGAAAGLLGFNWLASGEDDLIRSILARAVGPFTMRDADFSSFLADLESDRGETGDAKLALFRAVSLTEPGALLPYTPSGVRDRFEFYERQVVTSFLTRTDYLRIDPRESSVSFVGEAACNSPFARFDAA